MYSLFIMADVSAVTLPLAKRLHSLQSKQVDIASAHSHATKVIEVLQKMVSEKFFF